jgi:hypothetical protein
MGALPFNHQRVIWEGGQGVDLERHCTKTRRMEIDKHQEEGM